MSDATCNRLKNFPLLVVRSGRGLIAVGLGESQTFKRQPTLKDIDRGFCD
jgi:hypothetical protein